MAQKEAAEQFWDFALSVYGQDAAREAFLRLQNRDGADVPMLLWCLWCAEQGRGVSRSVMAEAVRFSSVWREAVVDPLRSTRTTLKDGLQDIPAALSDDARQKIAVTEQALERVQMEYLVELPGTGVQADGSGIIALYADVAGLGLGVADVDTVLASLAAPVPRA